MWIKILSFFLLCHFLSQSCLTQPKGRKQQQEELSRAKLVFPLNWFFFNSPLTCENLDDSTRHRRGISDLGIFSPMISASESSSLPWTHCAFRSTTSSPWVSSSPLKKKSKWWIGSVIPKYVFKNVDSWALLRVHWAILLEGRACETVDLNTHTHKELLG